MSYLDQLSHELGTVGVGGRLRRRILAEISDHLACDPDADLGAPDALAGRFADELGTSLTRRAAFVSFAALAIAGLAYAVVFAAISVENIRVPILAARTPLLGDLALATMLLAPQFAFVTGTLAALRAFRRRSDLSLPRAETRIVLRRAALALASGLAAMAGVALVVYEYSAELPAWLQALGYACAAVGGTAVAAALPASLAASRIRVTAAGESGDVFADLGGLVPPSLRGRPWVFAVAVAGVLCVVVTAAGVVQSDPFDGATRGLAEGLAVLAGFAALGRFLGLRTSN